MSLRKQITLCTFWVRTLDNSVLSGTVYPKRVEVYSGSITWKPYYLSGQPYDEALSGKLRPQLGGYRPFITLGWEKLTNTANLINIVNDAVIDGTRRMVIFAPNIAASLTSNINTIITDVTWSAEIDSTIVRQPISVTFAGLNVYPRIPASYGNV